MIFPAAAFPDGRHFLFGQRRLFMVSGTPMTAELFARIESQTIARQRVIVRLPTVNCGSTFRAMLSHVEVVRFWPGPKRLGRASAPLPSAGPAVHRCHRGR